MSAPLSREEVARVAALARLDLSEAEAALVGRQLGEILAFAGQIREVDTRGVPPMTLVHEAGPAMRPDEPRPSLPRDAALANAPASDAAGCFTVPRVLG